MKKGPYVRIEKISASEDPKCPTPSALEYDTLKEVALLSLPAEYWIEGYLIKEPEVNSPVIVQREVRNGVKVQGIFQTSLVTEITENGFKTLNSIYTLKKCE
jgi:hypothetical protein